MAALSVRLKSSTHLAAILNSAHIIAAVLLWPLALPIGIKLAGVVIMVMSLIYYLRHDALLSASTAVVAFELSDTMQCTLETRSGKSIICTILVSTFVAPYLTVVNLQPLDQFFARSVVILPDSIDAEEFRRLRVLLRWKWKDTK